MAREEPIIAKSYSNIEDAKFVPEDTSFQARLAAIRVKMKVPEIVVTPDAPQAVGPVAEKEKVISSVHQEFRDKLVTLDFQHVDTIFGGVETPNFKNESPFETINKDNTKDLIPAYKARDMFRDILVSDEKYPKGVSNHVLVHFIDPIVLQIKSLSEEIKNVADEKQKKQLREKRTLVSNSLRLAMKSVLEEPSLYNIDSQDFSKKTSELSVSIKEIQNRIKFNQPFPFHVSGRMLLPNEIKRISSEIIDQTCIPFESRVGSKEISGTIKTTYLDYLYKELREASAINSENISVTLRIKKQQEIEEKIALFLSDLQSDGGVQKYEAAILDNKTEDLEVDFPRLRLRPSPAIKKDPEACRAFYRNLVANYTEEQKEDLAQKFKYGYVDEGLYDEAGVKQLRHLRAEAEMLMREAGLTEGHIQQSWVLFLNPVMDTIAKKVQEISELRKENARINKNKITELQSDVFDQYRQINIGINKRIVNPKVYMLLNPLQQVDSIPSDAIASEAEVEDSQDLDFNIANLFDREERMAAFKLFRDAHIVALTGAVGTLGENAKHEVTDSGEYLQFTAALSGLRKLLFKTVEEFSQADVDVLSQIIDSFYNAYDALDAFIVDNFVVMEVEEFILKE